MKLYHISFYEVKYNLFVPRVPKTRLKGENNSIPRICFSETIEGCLSAIPNGLGAVKGLIDLQEQYGLIGVYLYEINIDQIKKENIVTPKELYTKGLVPDAEYTKEYWVINQKVKCKKPKILKIKDIVTFIETLDNYSLELVKKVDYNILKDIKTKEPVVENVFLNKDNYYEMKKWCYKKGNHIKLINSESNCYYCQVILNVISSDYYKMLTESLWILLLKNYKEKYTRNTILYVYHTHNNKKVCK